MNKIRRITEKMMPGYQWLAPPRSKVELAETAAREARYEAAWREHLRKHPPLDLRHVAVNVIHIPIFPEDEIIPRQERTHMATGLTTAEKIAKLKADPAVKSRTATPPSGAFNLKLFSSDAISAINAANAKNRFLPDADPSDRATTSLPPEGPPPSAKDHYAKAQEHMKAAESQLENLSDNDVDHLSLARDCILRCIETRGKLGMHARTHWVRFAS